jgi:hypothetical protein
MSTEMGSYPSGQRGLTVNQLSDDFVGSNPSLPTGLFKKTEDLLPEEMKKNGKPS